MARGCWPLWSKPSPGNLPLGPCSPGDTWPLSLQLKPCCDLTVTLSFPIVPVKFQEFSHFEPQSNDCCHGDE